MDKRTLPTTDHLPWSNGPRWSNWLDLFSTSPLWKVRRFGFTVKFYYRKYIHCGHPAPSEIMVLVMEILDTKRSQPASSAELHPLSVPKNSQNPARWVSVSRLLRILTFVSEWAAGSFKWAAVLFLIFFAACIQKLAKIEKLLLCFAAKNFISFYKNRGDFKVTWPDCLVDQGDLHPLPGQSTQPAGHSAPQGQELLHS